MNYASILSQARKSVKINLMENKDKSIELIHEDVFYVEPMYKDITYNTSANAIIFSAPGATGKSSLAKKIAFDYKVLYWDLSKIVLGDNSFVGTLYKSISNLNEYLNQLKKAETFIVIDAFDEAVLISGKRSVDNLIDEIIQICKDSTGVSFVLLARTETANAMISSFKEKSAKFAHFEIGFIPENNAKGFVADSVKVKNSNLNDCIDEQFRLIGQLLNDEYAKSSFLGYPPVLEALSSAFDEENNTIKLLNRLHEKGISEANKLIYNILDDLLYREQTKVVNALREVWGEKYPDFDSWDLVYKPYEQMVRILQFVLIQSYDLFENDLEVDMLSDYQTIVESFLPQHPFIKHAVGDSYDFTGPAFRDYVLAELLNDSVYDEFVDEYKSKYVKKTSVPSQLFFDFFTMKDNPFMHGDDFPLVYDSFKAKESVGCLGICKISEDDEGLTAVFGLEDEKNNEPIVINMNKEEPIVVTKLKDSSISCRCIVCLGKEDISASITDSRIDCKRLIINGSELYINANREGGVFLASTDEVVFENGLRPQIYINTNSDNDIRVDFPNGNKFYKLKKYLFSGMDTEIEEIMRFAAIVDKILDCMRKHKKDAPAKGCEYINNEIIANSEYKKQILQNLIELGIIFVDAKESHLYKLNVTKLGEYDIGWQTLDRFGPQKFKKLYDACKREK